MSESAILWSSFSVFVLGMLALDLGVFHRKSHAVSVKEALTLDSRMDNPLHVI